MGRRCSTVWDNESCTSGYASNTSGTRVLSFPKNREEKEKWCERLPNYLNPENVTDNMGICEKHWKAEYQYKIIPGGYKRPVNSPTEFGNTPNTLRRQSVSEDRSVEKRGVSSEDRSKVSATLTNNNDVVRSWEDLCDYCNKLHLPLQVSQDTIRLVNLTEDPMIIDFTVLIDSEFKVKAYKRSMVVNIREFIDSFQCKLILYSQIDKIITHLTDFPINLQNDVKHVGEHFRTLVHSELDEAKRKKLDFLFNQMILHAKDIGGHRFDVSTVRDALEIFLRSRNAYRALRDYLILPCDRTLKSYFGKLGAAGSSGECKAVITNVFSQLEGLDKCCYITADEIYVKASVRYRAGHIVGLGVDQDPPRPAKTILAFMVNFLYSTPAFIARLLPVFSLKAEFLMEQLMLLIQIIHDAGGIVSLVMTDNLSVNQKMFKLLKTEYGQHSLTAVSHPRTNTLLKCLHLFYDPPHMLKNIRNNWTTEKTQMLEFTDPVSGKIVLAKWNDLKNIYKDEVNNPVKTTKLDYQTLFPNNFEKQKMSLVLNIFNEKTIAALKKKKYYDTATFIERITQMWHILNVKSPNEGRNLNDPNRYPIENPNDERLIFLQRMSTLLKLMDSSKKGQRIRGLTGDTANAWHISLLGMVDLAKSLLASGMRYVCLGKFQSDRLEGEFGVIRQMSGGNYLISADQVFCSVSLRRIKLYHKLNLNPEELVTNEEMCCSGDLDDKDEDLELLDVCFSEASNLSESERSALYYICGYVTFKENLEGSNEVLQSTESEFTEMVSRGKLKHPTSDLYDLSLYLYSFFKMRKRKCCIKIFLQGFQYIHDCSGWKFPNIDKILKRFINCFFKGYATDETDKIRVDKAKENCKRKRKLNS